MPSMPRDPPILPRGPLPTPEETVSLLHQQAAYVNQIEAENRYMKVKILSTFMVFRKKNCMQHIQGISVHVFNLSLAS